MSLNRRIQGFSYYSCLMIEGSGSVQITTRIWIHEDEKIPYGSGSGSDILLILLKHHLYKIIYNNKPLS